MSLADLLDANATDHKQLIEPGLLAAFRLLMALPFVVGTIALVLNVVIRLFHPVPDFVAKIPLQLVIFFLSFQAITLTYLYWTQALERLGRYFLPIGLVLASTGEIALYTTVVMGDFERSMVSELLEKGAGSLYFLIIPLVLISWQYGYRPAIRYTLALVIFELLMVAVSLSRGQADAWLRLEFTVQRTIIFLVVAYLVTRVIMSQKKQREELYEANVRLQQYNSTLEQLAVSRERNRLARELHDILAHHMSGMVLQLEGTRLLWDQNLTQAKATLEESIDTARSGLTETRRALRALRASPLEDLGLREAIHMLATNTADRAGLHLDISLPDHVLQLSPTVEQAVYRIAQEALTNVERHAKATSLKVLLDQNDNELLLDIEDNGCGFELQKVNTDEHFGLWGIRERAEAIGGKLTVHSVVGQGAQMTFSVVV
ncbi:sensor histidine kinase [Chloroflexi bacterium TSY]|nr:sensor histidine kinase [Chloroflexi bacterium TSY]